MLGLADRTRIIDLFEALLRGDIAKALSELRDQYDSGADPAVVLSDLAEFTHFVTRVKVLPAVADDLSLAEAERTRGRTFAALALDARALAHLADAVQGARRGAGGGQAARRRRDGAGAHRLCGRPADAGRGDPRHPGERRGDACAGERQWRRDRARDFRAALRRAARCPARRACARAARHRAGAGYRHAARRACRGADAEHRDIPGAARARQREARHPDEDGARARRAAGGVSRTASSRSRSSRARARRWSTICRARFPNGPGGAGWSWCRPSRARRP